MAEFESDIAGAATAFAEVSSRAAASANVQRLRLAEGNIRAGTQQIKLEESVNRRTVARALNQFQGSQAAGRAFRGTGGGDIGTGAAVMDAATAQAADQAAVIEANAAAKEIALVVANQPILEDPMLAAIQGGVQGLNIGVQIAQALIGEGEVTTSQSTRQLGGSGAFGAPSFPVFQNTITTDFEIPGLDLSELFPDLFD